LSVKSYLEHGEVIALELNQKINIPFRIDDWVTIPIILGISLFLSLTIVQTSQQSEFNFKGNISLYSVVLSIICTTYILLLENFLKDSLKHKKSYP
jgi:hypothetical protein